MRTILFDLDGTLLPMDQDHFTKVYLTELGKKGASLGYDPKELVGIVMAGLEVMVANDGTMTNEERFWELFIAKFGGDVKAHTVAFEDFYRNEFKQVAKATQPTALARRYVDILKKKGYQLVLATNPIFPQIATYERMRWAGLKPDDFSLVTTYENSSYAKPNPNYYQEILQAIAAEPENCLMIGNDAYEDVSATKLGIDVYLVTDDLINSQAADISSYRQGTRADLLAYLQQLDPLS